MNTSDWIGTVGVFLILVAYFCSTFGWMSSQSRVFFALNTIGATMTCYASYLIKYWPFAVLEGTWTVVYPDRMVESKTMNVYFISGLGADERAFERIKLPDEYAIHHLRWIAPEKNESLNDYAVRLGSAIDTSKPFAIVGLSMGGMIASVLSKELHPQKTVLVSSIGCNGEFPPLLRFARATKAYKLLPKFIFRPEYLGPVQLLMGTRAKEQKALIQDFISKTDPHFMKWAIGAIINWADCERPGAVFHIHGNRDKMFPLKYTKPNAVVEGGSHFMVWTKAGEVSRLIKEALQTQPGTG